MRKTPFETDQLHHDNSDVKEGLILSYALILNICIIAIIIVAMLFIKIDGKPIFKLFF